MFISSVILTDFPQMLLVTLWTQPFFAFFFCFLPRESFCIRLISLQTFLERILNYSVLTLWHLKSYLRPMIYNCYRYSLLKHLETCKSVAVFPSLTVIYNDVLTCIMFARSYSSNTISFCILYLGQQLSKCFDVILDFRGLG